MSLSSRDGGYLSRLLWWALSVSLHWKVLGIGALVAVLFGSVALFHLRVHDDTTLCQLLEARTLLAARSLAADLDRPLMSGDPSSVQDSLRRTKASFPDMRYAIVRDKEGGVIAHTFAKAVPPDLLEAGPGGPAPEGTIEVLDTEEGPVFDATCSIHGGQSGTVRLGATNRMVVQGLADVARMVLQGLIFGMAVVLALGLALSCILMHPIGGLMQAASRIREGAFDARAPIFSGDEVGSLALSFNQMAEGLERYRRDVLEKEKALETLLDKIVQAQEEERTRVSRELHDELGQSLLALLLAIQSGCRADRVPPANWGDMEERVRYIIDTVRRMAKGMRPPILDDYGLDSALSRHAQDIGKLSGIEIDYQYSGAPGAGRLPGRIETTLYRIAQEATTNILRYAQARRASIVLIRRQEDATLVVEDDGKGFDPIVVKERQGGGFGLTGMRERAAMVGGTCDVESAPGKGTTVRVWVPLGGGQTCRSES